MLAQSAAYALARCAQGSPNASVLAIIPDDSDLKDLRAILGAREDPLWCAASARAARLYLSDSRVGIIICDSTLPDGSWRGLLEDAVRLVPAPGFILACSPGERLTTEALWCGASDVITKPFDSDDVLTATGVALRKWELNRAAEARQRAPVYTMPTRTVPWTRRLLARFC